MHREHGLSDRRFFELEFPDTLGKHGSIVACATIRNVFYAAVKNNDTAPYKPTETWALVVLIQRSRGWINFAYKEMDEGMGPTERNAPVSVLDALSPADSEWANEWRNDCRAALPAKTARPKIKRGDHVTFSPPLKFRDGSEHQTFTFVARSTFAVGSTFFRIPHWRMRAYAVHH